MANMSGVRTRSQGPVLESRTRKPSKAFAGCELPVKVSNFMQSNFTAPPEPSNYSYGKARHPKAHSIIKKKVLAKPEAPKQEEIYAEPDLGNGRIYTHEIVYDSPQAKEEFEKLWSDTEIPNQHKKLVARSSRYFKKLAIDERDPALNFVKVDRSKNQALGKGAIAIKEIREGTLIGHYAGKIRKKTENDDSRYAFSFDMVDIGEWILCAATHGNALTCINHSKNPNVTAFQYMAKEGPRIIFIADKTIPKGAELFFNYGDDYWNNVGFKPKNVTS